MVLGAAACSGGHGNRAAPGPAAPGSITVDAWKPPQLTGPPSAAGFCSGLVAIYRHMAELSHAGSVRVTKQILSDYVTFAPTLVAQSPASLHPAAAAYIDAVAGYLQTLARAGLDFSRLPAGSLAPLSSPAVGAAYSQLTSFSSSQCHYVIGGSPSA